MKEWSCDHSLMYIMIELSKDVKDKIEIQHLVTNMSYILNRLSEQTYNKENILAWLKLMKVEFENIERKYNII